MVKSIKVSVKEYRAMKESSGLKIPPPAWRQPDGVLVACEEKLAVLNENLAEIQDICQEALEDGVLMGCDEQQLRDYLHSLVAALTNPYSSD